MVGLLVVDLGLEGNLGLGVGFLVGALVGLLVVDLGLEGSLGLRVGFLVGALVGLLVDASGSKIRIELGMSTDI